MARGKIRRDLPFAPAGWGRSGEAGKFHWFPEGSSVSACQKVGGFRGPRFPDLSGGDPPCGLCKARKPADPLPG